LYQRKKIYIYQKLSNEIIKQMRKAEEITVNNNGGTLAICLNYGGTVEIAAAVNKILKNASYV
jgi:undecaprenyl diphosphate synthase